jgi:hypothetical protein
MTSMKIAVVALLAPLAVALGKPPAAWVVTSGGRVQLGYSSYCWITKRRSVCADFIAPHCGKGPGSAPVVRVRRGERVRFELGFAPRSVSLSVGRGATHKLAATRHPTWRATQSGPLALFADAKANGDAGYVACIVFRR